MVQGSLAFPKNPCSSLTNQSHAPPVYPKHTSLAEANHNLFVLFMELLDPGITVLAHVCRARIRGEIVRIHVERDKA